MRISSVFSVKNVNFKQTDNAFVQENKRMVFQNNVDRFVSFGSVKDYNTENVLERQEIIDNIPNYKSLGKVSDGEIFLLPDNKHMLKMFDSQFSKDDVQNLLTTEVNQINNALKKNPNLMKEMGISIAEYRWAAYDKEKNRSFVCYRKPRWRTLAAGELGNPEISKKYINVLDLAEKYEFPIFELSFNKDVLPKNSKLAPIGFSFLSEKGPDGTAFDGKIKPIDNMGMVDVNVPYVEWDRTPVFNPEKNPRRIYTALETLSNPEDRKSFVKMHTEMEIDKLKRRNGLSLVSLAKDSFRDRIRKNIADSIDSSDTIDVIATDISFKGSDKNFEKITDNLINAHLLDHYRKSTSYSEIDYEYLNGRKIKEVHRTASLDEIKSPRLLITEEEK